MWSLLLPLLTKITSSKRVLGSQVGCQKALENKIFCAKFWVKQSSPCRKVSWGYQTAFGKCTWVWRNENKSFAKLEMSDFAKFCRHLWGGGGSGAILRSVRYHVFKCVGHGETASTSRQGLQTGANWTWRKSFFLQGCQRFAGVFGHFGKKIRTLRKKSFMNIRMLSRHLEWLRSTVCVSWSKQKL